MSFSELCVTVKDEDKTLKKTFLLYEIYQVDDNDQTIKDCIEETLEVFGSDPESIKVTITLDMQ